jgi:hypothetical protein
MVVNYFFSFPLLVFLCLTPPSFFLFFFFFKMESLCVAQAGLELLGSR